MGARPPSSSASARTTRWSSPVWIAGPAGPAAGGAGRRITPTSGPTRRTPTANGSSQAIDYLAHLPATKALVDAHSRAATASPRPATASRSCCEFWRRRGDDGALVHDLHDESLSTRFLGDLYQDLSEHAKKTYALLQTPVFVEEFILDRTLEPALADRPLEGFRMIDPTCGSGHFLLGAFDRLLDRWHKHAPGLEIQARVQRRWMPIHGVDLNPFAVAIARFRLTVAAFRHAGCDRLEQAPAFHFHLAVGDSLLHGPRPRDCFTGHEAAVPSCRFALRHRRRSSCCSDHPRRGPLRRGGGQPAVHHGEGQGAQQDRTASSVQRLQGTYALTVPFMEQFFALG